MSNTRTRTAPGEPHMHDSPARTTTATAATIARTKVGMKAIADEINRDLTEQPEHAQLFLSGLIVGFAAVKTMLDGGSAEAALEQMETHLNAAIGRAYLNGTLGPQQAEGGRQ